MKKKISSIILISFLMLMSSLFFTNATSTTPAVIGKIEGLQIESGAYWVYGWACQQKASGSIALHFYTGGPAGQGQFVHHGATTYVAENEITSSANCQSITGAKHRFKIKLDDQVLAKAKGLPMYIHGISLLKGAPNPLIENSGVYRFPQTLASSPSGCQPTSMSKKETRNVYQSPYLQAQGSPWIYVAWVWRETEDASTNHSLSVARTKDMIHWENTCGEPLALPIKSDSRAVIDPVLPKNGILNGVKLSFDRIGRPVISYHKHKYDFSTTQIPIVTTQVYNARLEESGWKFYQMTNWNVKSNQSGGGSLPAGPTTPSYSGVSYNRSGIMYQSFGRPSADSTGTPSSGTWQINDDFTVSQYPYNKNSAPVDHYNPTSGIPSFSLTPEARDPNWKTPFTVRTIRPVSDERWIVLRGDWDGDKVNGPGLFDRKTRTFVIRNKDNNIIFPFGPGLIPLLPVVYDWDGDGIETIGVYDSVKTRMYIKNSFQGGSGDPFSLSLSQVKIKDGPLRWYPINPALTHMISYEILKANNDLPYDCNGVPLKVNSAAAFETGKKVLATCSTKFLSNLYLHIYNLKTKTWAKIFIDRVWSVGGSFAFQVFKGHQIIAYYDANRNVKVAIRNGSGIKYQVLDRVFEGWDSHNNLTLTIDEHHDIHLAGDQHVNKLNYWRTTGGLVPTFKRYKMTGVAEEQVTYPSFFRSPSGDLLFQYRNGYSGNGEWIINRFDIWTGKWNRFLNNPIFGKE